MLWRGQFEPLQFRFSSNLALLQENMPKFCMDPLIPPAAQLLPPSLLSLHDVIRQQLEMAVSLQKRFKQISPSFQYHQLKLKTQKPEGSELPSSFIPSPRDHPEKIAKLWQRLPQNEAELRFLGSLLRRSSYGNFIIEPFCSALNQLQIKGQIAQRQPRLQLKTDNNKQTLPSDLICSHSSVITFFEGWFEIHGNACRPRTWFCSCSQSCALQSLYYISKDAWQLLLTSHECHPHSSGERPTQHSQAALRRQCIASRLS